MITEIKAIDTRYNNCRFRSRLEARWAVFFDVLGVKWDYEPQGYTLGNTGNYLPDFWLPEWKCFAEIKPSYLTEDQMLLCSFLPAKCLILDGKPADRFYFCTEGDTDNDHFDPYNEYCAYTNDNGTAVDLWTSKCKQRLWITYEGDTPNSGAGMHRAIEAALSARFEFGESGAPR